MAAKAKTFRPKKGEEWFRFACALCQRKSRLIVEKGFRFTAPVLAHLKCTECTWGGPGGLKRHGLATKRASRVVADLVRMSTGCTPGPEFYVQLWADAPDVENDGGSYTFPLGTFEGAPLTLQILVRGKVGK